LVKFYSNEYISSHLLDTTAHLAGLAAPTTSATLCQSRNITTVYYPVTVKLTRCSFT